MSVFKIKALCIDNLILQSSKSIIEGTEDLKERLIYS